jgi:hypothetical protein
MVMIMVDKNTVNKSKNGTANNTPVVLEDPKINVKLKIAGLWITAMFLFIYVDYFGLFIPGVMENIIDGEVAHTGVNISQAFLMAGIILMMVPSIMIFLSLALPAKTNRSTNIIVGIAYSVVLVGGLYGETWAFYIFATMVEVGLISLAVWYAWNWPKQEVNSEVENS